MTVLEGILSRNFIYVLNINYKGEANVNEGFITSFLGLAEDLEIKGHHCSHRIQGSPQKTGCCGGF